MCSRSQAATNALNFRAFLENELPFLLARPLRQLVIWDQFSPIWGFSIWGHTDDLYPSFSPHESGYFRFILSSRVGPTQRTVVLWAPPSVVLGLSSPTWAKFSASQQPVVSFEKDSVPQAKATSNVEPLPWISVFFRMLIRYYLITLLALWCLDDLYILPWPLSCLQPEGCSESPTCHYQRGGLFSSFSMVLKRTQKSCAFYINLTVCFPKSIPACLI